MQHFQRSPEQIKILHSKVKVLVLQETGDCDLCIFISDIRVAILISKCT